MLHTDEVTTESGFVGGDADPPHFTREMPRRAGRPPAAHRLAFRTAPPDREPSGQAGER